MGGMAKEESGSNNNGSHDFSNSELKLNNLLNDTADFSTANFKDVANSNLLEKTDQYQSPNNINSAPIGLSNNNYKNKTRSKLNSSTIYDDAISDIEPSSVPEIDTAKEMDKKNDQFAKQQLKQQKEKAKIAEKEKKAHYKRLDQQKKILALETTKKSVEPTTKVALPTTKPKQPQLVDLVSNEAKEDSESLASTIANKSGEMNGLPPVIDTMISDDPLEGEAVSDDFAYRLEKLDPEAAIKYRELVHPIHQKHAPAINKAKAEVDARYRQELDAYNQYKQSLLESDRLKNTRNQQVTFVDAEHSIEQEVQSHAQKRTASDINPSSNIIENKNEQKSQLKNHEFSSQKQDQDYLKRTIERQRKVKELNDRITTLVDNRLGTSNYLNKVEALEEEILSKFDEDDLYGSNLLNRLRPYDYKPTTPLTPQQMQFTSHHLKYQDNLIHKERVEKYGAKEYYRNNKEALEGILEEAEKYENLTIIHTMIKKGYFGEKPTTERAAELDNKLYDRLLTIDSFMEQAIEFSSIPHRDIDPAYVEHEETWKKDVLDHGLDTVDAVSWLLPVTKVVSTIAKGAKTAKAAKATFDVATDGANFYNSYRNSILGSMEKLVKDYNLPRDPNTLREYLVKNPNTFRKIRLKAMGKAMYDTGKGKLSGEFVKRYNKNHKTKFGSELNDFSQKSLETATNKLATTIGDNISSQKEDDAENNN